jgi:branched-chain amino acid transport system ATP-binding protein
MTIQGRVRSFAMPAVLVVLTAAAALYAARAEGYAPFVLAMVALTTIVGVGLNILVGLTGQISLGHVGFYAIGGYTVAILTLQGVRQDLSQARSGYCCRCRRCA